MLGKDEGEGLEDPIGIGFCLGPGEFLAPEHKLSK
jgi:hypothetical protein